MASESKQTESKHTNTRQHNIVQVKSSKKKKKLLIKSQEEVPVENRKCTFFQLSIRQAEPKSRGWVFLVLLDSKQATFKDFPTSLTSR